MSTRHWNGWNRLTLMRGALSQNKYINFFVIFKSNLFSYSSSPWFQFQEFVDGLKRAGVNTNLYLQKTENDVNIKETSLSQFKRIVIEPKVPPSDNGDREETSKPAMENSKVKRCRRNSIFQSGHSAIYCHVCFPHNINGFK